ncbi:MAG: tautomerase family protein [Candidatus Bathyarchaeia archaeon]
MSIVHVYAWSGFSNEAKKKVIAGITRLFTEIGIHASAVEVLIHEVPRENWRVGEERASEKFKHVQLP